MRRNLDLTALRSFVAVADAGGVTRASGFLNLTQSAVSMQLKRLEESLGISLLDRTARTVSLTGEGEQLLGYARRMLELNDEVIARMTDEVYEGEIKLGVPHDIVYPAIPEVLKRFAADFPRVRVNLESSFTKSLREQFARGDIDIILTTEDGVGDGGETLVTVPLVWVGAPGGQAWRQRPLRLAFEKRCIFRVGVQSSLDEAGIRWEMAVESEQTSTIEATVAADLAVHVSLQGAGSPRLEAIQHAGALPTIPGKDINLYASDSVRSGRAASELLRLLRQAYQSRVSSVIRAA
ncbi:MAG: LysR family transcriptional regulator [Deltaproteobacteria bacterium]